MTGQAEGNALKLVAIWHRQLFDRDAAWEITGSPPPCPVELCSAGRHSLASELQTPLDFCHVSIRQKN